VNLQGNRRARPTLFSPGDGSPRPRIGRAATRKVFCSTEMFDAQRQSKSVLLFERRAIMIYSRSLLTAGILGWASVSSASATSLPLVSALELATTKVAQCCTCISHINPQTGCSKYDCPECPESAPIPNIRVKRASDCPQRRVLVCTDPDSSKKSTCTLMCKSTKKAN